MDFLTVRNRVKIINVANARIVSHAFSIAPEGFGEEHTKTVDTRKLPQNVLEDLNIFFARGEITAEVVEENVAPQKSINVSKIHTANGEGEKHEHTVFKPSDRAINVEEITSNGKAIEVGFSKIDAVELLQKHWKTLEKEVANITDVDKIKYILVTAKEMEITGKKLEVVESRLGEL